MKSICLAVHLSDADLSYATLWGVNLSTAMLGDGILIKTLFWDSKLCGATMHNADMSMKQLYLVAPSNSCLILICLGVNLSKATGLTQEQLNQACAHPEHLPKRSHWCTRCEHRSATRMAWETSASLSPRAETFPRRARMKDYPEVLTPPKTHPHPSHKPPNPAPCSDSPGSDRTSGASSPAPRARSRKALLP